MLEFFVTPVVEDGYTTYQLTTTGYTALICIAIVLLLVGCAIFGSKRKTNTRQLTFSAMAIALATVTSFLKIWPMPMGGSVTLFSMLFITLIGSWFGIGSGLTAALAYGILQLLIDPYILSLPQMLLDYIFAFGALGLSGLCHGRKHAVVKGYLLGCFGRFVFSTLSGYLFFPTFLPEFLSSALVYSICYNGAYIGAEVLLTLLLLNLPPIKKALAHVKSLS